MGIINVSPESFYRGSIKTTTGSIANSAVTMERQGADIIDIGAMSTAPYLENVIPVEKEIKRMGLAIKIVRKIVIWPSRLILRDLQWLEKQSTLSGLSKRCNWVEI